MREAYRQQKELTLKYQSKGELSSFKARFGAKNFRQAEVMDFHKMYSPTTKMSTKKIVLSLAVQNKHELR